MEEIVTTIVIGLGNPILGDDGVGWRVAEELRARLGPQSSLEVECLSVGGLGLMERMIGYRRAIVIDAITTREGTQGNLSYFPLSALPDLSAGHTTSAHDTSLQNALNVGREMGMEVPTEVWVVAIEAKETHEFSEQLSPAVEAAIPRATDIVVALLSGEAVDDDLT